MPGPDSDHIPSWDKLSLRVLLAISGCCLFVCLFIVPRFEQIFADALPGEPLPRLTTFFLMARLPLAIINAVWAVGGILLLRRQHPAAILVINLSIVWCLLQIGTSIVALLLPMLRLTVYSIY